MNVESFAPRTGVNPQNDARALAQTASGEAYAELRQALTRAGLFERTYGYYVFRTLQSFAFVALGLALAFVLPPTFFSSLLIAVWLGFAIIQVALIGHDAGHLAVFRSTRLNWALGLVCWSLTVGIGFWYWYDRHNKHHAHTNDVGRDPDLAGSDLVAFTIQEARARRGWRRWVAEHQASLSPFFVVFVFLAAYFFRAESWVYALRHLRGKRLLLELTLLALNLALWLAPCLVLGSYWLVIYVIGQSVGGTYYSLIVAPNHKGMTVWARDAELSFLERQVISSRNVHAQPLWDFLFGGLNYQIEHHLFPTMPRVNFKRARALVKPFCLARGLPYEEVDPLTSYRAFFAELRRVGMAVNYSELPD